MRKLFSWIVACLLVSSILEAESDIEKCLFECYGIVDDEEMDLILSKLEPLLEDHYSDIIDDFIARSYEKNIEPFTSKPSYVLNSNDAILAAPESHEILAENEAIRILWVFSPTEEHKTPHTHQWSSLMIIIKPAIFEVYRNGVFVMIDEDPIGVYDIPPTTGEFVYKRISPDRFEAVVFEIKS
jgi:hypothetical protein